MLPKDAAILPDSAWNEIAVRLRAEILSGRIPAGERLRQDHLAERLGVSHIPVREALRQLASEGFVTITPRRGAVVSQLDARQFEEVMWLRGLLEPALLRQAIPRMTEGTLDDARRILAAIDATKTAPAWAELNHAFHIALCQPACRMQAYAIVERLHMMQERYLRLAATLTGDVDTLQAEHYAILDAIERGDVEAAVTLLEDHIAVGGRALLTILQDDATAAATALQPARERSAARSA